MITTALVILWVVAKKCPTTSINKSKTVKNWIGTLLKKKPFQCIKKCFVLFKFFFINSIVFSVSKTNNIFIFALLYNIIIHRLFTNKNLFTSKPLRPMMADGYVVYSRQLVNNGYPWWCFVCAQNILPRSQGLRRRNEKKKSPIKNRSARQSWKHKPPVLTLYTIPIHMQSTSAATYII